MVGGSNGCVASDAAGVGVFDNNAGWRSEELYSFQGRIGIGNVVK